MRRVLFVQLAESGSMVLADPAMRALTARSGAQAYCLTFAHNRDSLAIAGTVPRMPRVPAVIPVPRVRRRALGGDELAGGRERLRRLPGGWATNALHS